MGRGVEVGSEYDSLEALCGCPMLLLGDKGDDERMLRQGVCQDWRTSWYAVSNWQRMWSGVESGSLCMTLTDQHSWKGNWWDCMWMVGSIPWW